MYNTHLTGFYRPFDFIVAVRAINTEIFNTLGAEEGRSEKANSLLTPFYKQGNCIVERRPDGDFITKPADYVYFYDCNMNVQAGRAIAEPKVPLLQCGAPLDGQDASDFTGDETITYKKVPVTKITANRRAAVTEHVHRGPSLKSPYIIPKEDGFEVLPNGIGVITLGYLRLPAEPVFQYSERQDGPDTYLDYVEAGSVHLEWSEALRPAFLYKLGRYYNLTIKDELRLQVQAIDKLLL